MSRDCFAVHRRTDVPPRLQGPHAPALARDGRSSRDCGAVCGCTDLEGVVPPHSGSTYTHARASLKMMIKALESAIAQIKDLPLERQAYAALVLKQIAADDGTSFEVPDEHRAAVLEGLAQAERGEFATDADVERALLRPWA